MHNTAGRKSVELPNISIYPVVSEVLARNLRPIKGLSVNYGYMIINGGGVLTG